MSDLILVAIISIVPATITAIAAVITGLRTARKIEQVARNTNGLASELIKVTRTSAYAEGRQARRATDQAGDAPGS